MFFGTRIDIKRENNIGEQMEKWLRVKKKIGDNICQKIYQ